MLSCSVKGNKFLCIWNEIQTMGSLEEKAVDKAEFKEYGHAGP